MTYGKSLPVDFNTNILTTEFENNLSVNFHISNLRVSFIQNGIIFSLLNFLLSRDLYSFSRNYSNNINLFQRVHLVLPVKVLTIFYYLSFVIFGTFFYASQYVPRTTQPLAALHTCNRQKIGPWCGRHAEKRHRHAVLCTEKRLISVSCDSFREDMKCSQHKTR